MVENDLAEIIIRDGDDRIVLRRQSPQLAPPAVAFAPGAPIAPAAVPPPSAPAASAAEAGLDSIDSPMVGTFYVASDPESPPFVKPGDRVTPDTVVCIIEAMKVFNEIKAEKSGTVVSIEVANAAPVEYGQPLIKIRPHKD